MNNLKGVKQLVTGVLLIMTAGYAAGDQSSPNASGLPIIILKADDLTNYKSSGKSEQESNWKQFVRYLADTKSLTANIGAVGDQFQSDGTTSKAFYDDVRQNIVIPGVIEIFNHANCFCPESFSNNVDTQTQYANVNAAQNIISSALGVRPTVFGAPGNRKSKGTVEMMNRHPDMKVWFYGIDEVEGISLNRDKVINLERVANTSLDSISSAQSIIETVERNQSKGYLVFQGHPGNWSDSQFALFKSAFDALLRKYPAIKSMTASQYAAQAQQGQNSPIPVTDVDEPSQVSYVVPTPPQQITISFGQPNPGNGGVTPPSTGGDPVIDIPSVPPSSPMPGRTVLSVDFENNSIKPLGSQSYYDHALRVVALDDPDMSNGGNRFLRVEMNPDDTNHNNVRRAEVHSSFSNVMQADRMNWVEWYMYFPKDFNPGKLSGNLIVGQIHGNANPKGAPVSVLNLSDDKGDGRYYWGINNSWMEGGSVKSSNILVRGKFADPFTEYGKWVHFRWQFKPSLSGNGVVRIWKDKQLLGERVNMNVGTSVSVDPYFKTGLYHHGSNKIVVYVDNIKISVD